MATGSAGGAAVPEKVKAVMRMQQMAAPILRARGKKVRVWELEPSEK